MPIGPGQPAIQFTPLGVGQAPTMSGVYVLCGTEGNYLYFGETENLQRRLSEHLADSQDCARLKGATLYAYELHDTGDLRTARQRELIEKYQSPCNVGATGT